ncbi:MAG: GntR family transcriptional regulator [Gammaproteobacteria bacterium]
MAIQRVNLRDQVRDELVEWLADGRLPPGQRLEEARLSKGLGVSRTPLREALSKLATEGLVEAVPRRGFRVPKLSAERVRDLYPVIGSLEGLALRLSGPRVRELAAGLDRLNERLAVTHLSPRQRADLDRRWHEMLVSRNPNRELAALLERTRSRVRPYAGSWDRAAAELEASRAEHAEIARLLGTGQVDEAAEAVLRHWVRGIRVVTTWVEAQG